MSARDSAMLVPPAVLSIDYHAMYITCHNVVTPDSPACCSEISATERTQKETSDWFIRKYCGKVKGAEVVFKFHTPVSIGTVSLYGP